MLVEVAASLLTAEGRIKRQWLLDAFEISCISEYPSTVSSLKFKVHFTRRLLGIVPHGDVKIRDGSCASWISLLGIYRDRHVA